jgi:uncharacterized membrane protein
MYSRVLPSIAGSFGLFPGVEPSLVPTPGNRGALFPAPLLEKLLSKKCWYFSVLIYNNDMPSRRSFLKKLGSEIVSWTADGIIDEDQQEKILTLYRRVPKPGEKSVNKRLPAIIIGLAAVLLCSGIILFYAANWRRMPPTVKLIQVFVLIIGTYTASYYMLAVRKTNIFIGRILLMVGMVSFGAGIALVAQIYHISATPKKGILAWAFGVLAVSFVTKEKWGYYLAAALFFVWNVWEISVYGNPNYVFIIFPVVLFYLFYRSKAVTGVVLAVFGFLFWYYQLNIYWIFSGVERQLRFIPSALFYLTHLPLGVIFVGLGRIAEKDNIFKIPAKIYTVSGYFFIAGAFLFLSWPAKVEPLYLSFHETGIFQSIEFLVLLLIAQFVIFMLREKSGTRLLLALCAGFSAVLFALPLGDNSVLMISTHIGALGFLFGMLYFYSAGEKSGKTEYFLSFFIFLLFLVVKSLGMLILGLLDKNYFIVYCIGGLLYVIVSLLINQSVKSIFAKKGAMFQASIINRACAFAGYSMVYALSFRVEKTQASIFQTDSVVMALSASFLLIAVSLYIFLWLKSEHKLITALSAIVFIPSVIVLFIAGPKISWIAYSIIFNAMLFIILGILIYYSTQTNSKILLNFSIGVFMLHVLTRYFDVFWDLLSGSLLFIITGVLGIGGGWLLWKIRKKLIKQMEHGKSKT